MRSNSIFQKLNLVSNPDVELSWDVRLFVIIQLVMEQLVPILVYFNNLYVGINEIIMEFLALVVILDIDDWVGDMFETYCKTNHPFYRQGYVGFDKNSEENQKLEKDDF